MSLSERLQKARTQQLIEQGLVAHDQTDEPEPEPEPVSEVEPEPVADDTGQDLSGGLFAPIIIEAQPVGLHLVATATVDLTERHASSDTALCPTCNARGVADMVDLVGHTVHYTCGTCSTMWQVRRPVIAETTAAG